MMGKLDENFRFYLALTVIIYVVAAILILTQSFYELQYMLFMVGLLTLLLTVLCKNEEDKNRRTKESGL